MSITIKMLCFSYTEGKSFHPVFHDLNLFVRDGEFLSILGPSGCGKTTLLHLIGGMLSPQEGSISFEGKSTVSYLFQDNNLLPWYTLGRNLTVAAEITGKTVDANTLSQTLSDYGLLPWINSYPKQLSGGMRQRAALIRTLLLDADILLLDEPFTGLDYEIRQILYDELHTMVCKTGKTALMVTHNMDEAILCSDRILRLDQELKGIQEELILPFEKELCPTLRRRTKAYHKVLSHLTESEELS